MVISELKPLIDARFRTLTDPANTAIGGSSLGGLSTLYAALRHPDVFGGAAVMSPSVWWGDRVILGDVDAFKAPAKPRIWLDIGGKEGAEAISGVRALKSRLEQRGWNDANFRFFEDPRGDHSERAWAKRARMILEFLFPPREV